MVDFKRVTEHLHVSVQITAEDLAEAQRRGFTTIINNRPDHEAPDQPTSASLRASAEALGFAFVEIPVAGPPSDAAASSFGQALREAKGPVLAFCRSGTRSITLWALSQAQSGARTEDLIATALKAGYDLSPLEGRLSQLSQGQ